MRITGKRQITRFNFCCISPLLAQITLFISVRVGKRRFSISKGGRTIPYLKIKHLAVSYKISVS